MIKLIIVGLIGAASTMLGVWYNVHSSQSSSAEHEQAASSAVPVSTEVTGIPVLSDGAIKGYLVFKVSTTIDTKKLADEKFDLGPYILDSAIKAGYEKATDIIKGMTAEQAESLSERIKHHVNTRFGQEVVQTVNLVQFNFVPDSQIRDMIVTGTAPKANVPH
jgi:flagellar basal body-associated protein FliL